MRTSRWQTAFYSALLRHAASPMPGGTRMVESIGGHIVGAGKTSLAFCYDLRSDRVAAKAVPGSRLWDRYVRRTPVVLDTDPHLVYVGASYVTAPGARPLAAGSPQESLFIRRLTAAVHQATYGSPRDSLYQAHVRRGADGGPEGVRPHGRLAPTPSARRQTSSMILATGRRSPQSGNRDGANGSER